MVVVTGCELARFGVEGGGGVWWTDVMVWRWGCR